MTQILKQSTAVDVLIGPFVDLTDGATAETGESPSVKLSKNGQTLAAKNDVTTPAHDADGYYNCELDTTDTNTVGTLILTVAASATALPVRHEFQVVEEAIYDALIGASAAGFDSNQRVDVGSWLGTAVTTSATTAKPEVDVNSISDDATAANNAELDYDGTGYNKSNSTIGTASALTTNNDKTGYALSSAGVQAIWDALTSALTTAGSVGKLIVDNLNATISSRSSHSAADAGAAAWDAARTSHTTAGSFGEGVASVQGDVTGNVDGSVASVTGSVTVGTNNDKTGYALSSAGIQAIWDALTSALTTAGSIGKLLVDNVNATISSRSSHAAADVWSVGTRVLTANTNLNDPTAASIADAVWDEAKADHTGATTFGDIATDLDAALADTNELQGDWADGGRLDLLIDAIKAETDKIDATIPDSVPADGTRPTPIQALYMINQFLYERAVSGTTVTVRKADGSTALVTLTLDDGTSPTSITRAT